MNVEGRWKRSLALVVVMASGFLGWWLWKQAQTPEQAIVDLVVEPAVRRQDAPAPRQLSSDLVVSEEMPARLLLVEVVDILGGPVEDAAVDFEGRFLGQTDGAGTLNIDAAKSPMPRAGLIEVNSDGYAQASKLVTVPGHFRITLVPEATIAGVVVERRTGNGIAGLQVATREHVTASDADGRFFFRGLGPGIYDVSARGKGYAGATSEPVGVGLGTNRDDVRVVVDPSLTINGRVHSAGRPPKALFYALALKQPANSGVGDAIALDKEGRFVISNLSAGDYRLRIFPREAVSAGQFSPLLMAPVMVSVQEGSVDVEIDIGELYTLLVEVVDDRGNPVPGIAIKFAQSNELELVGSSRETDAFGRAWIDGLVAGPVKQVRPNIEGIEAVNANVPSDASVRFIIPARASIHGRLATEDGSSPRSRLLALRADDSGSVVGWTNSDLDGRFRLEGLNPGSFSVEIYANGGEVGVVMEASKQAPEFVVPVALRGGQEFGEMLVTLPVRRGALRGRVVDHSGTGVAAAVVSYDLDRDQQPDQVAGVGDSVTVTDAGGEYLFADVEVGPALVVTTWAPSGAHVMRRGVVAGSEPIKLELE